MPRGHQRSWAGAGDHLQQGRRHGAAERHQQGDRAGGCAKGARLVAAQRRRHRRRGERPCLHACLRPERRRRQRPARGQGHRRPRHQGPARRRRQGTGQEAGQAGPRPRHQPPRRHPHQRRRRQRHRDLADRHAAHRRQFRRRQVDAGDGAHRALHRGRLPVLHRRSRRRLRRAGRRSRRRRRQDGTHRGAGHLPARRDRHQRHPQHAGREGRRAAGFRVSYPAGARAVPAEDRAAALADHRRSPPSAAEKPPGCRADRFGQVCPAPSSSPSIRT